mmetsp:Transcript_39073/g.100999  ORF Transcript_39073/g.100999 Transcript_39073/m.100999 type:complete len:87 (+) Transcript_39073:184-444(+)
MELRLECREQREDAHRLGDRQLVELKRLRELPGSGLSRDSGRCQIQGSAASRLNVSCRGKSPQCRRVASSGCEGDEGLGCDGDEGL